MKYYNLTQTIQFLKDYPLPKTRLGFRVFVQKNPAMFFPKIIGEGNGRRYYFSEKNIEEVKKFFDEEPVISEKP